MSIWYIIKVMQIYAGKKFNKPICVLKAFNNKDFRSVFELLDIYRKDYYILGYVRYEAKDVFLGKEVTSSMPLCYFEVFDEYEEYTPSERTDDVFIKIEPLISRECYCNAISDIKKYIEKGYTYEVNYTYPSKVTACSEPLSLYERLLKEQTTPYNAFIKNSYEEILSFSPELFFRLKGNKILTKPMKGTVARGFNPKEDAKNIEFLRNDEKNRAENVMIVDLLRNDLGRIAKTGTVNVDKLFEIETHKTIHQMTSEISAELETTKLYKIFEAIFPCGSITGAPKISTMKIIEALEVAKRDVYCGAIGFLSPDECVFSVPIRILQKKQTEDFYTFHSGGAIVWDSSAKDEWVETKEKRRFIEIMPEFKLIETMKCENNRIVFEAEHLARLRKSAEFFGFEIPENIKISTDKDGMVRMLLNKKGDVEFQVLDLSEPVTDKVIINPCNLYSKELFLKHKTTIRPWYKNSMTKIKNGEIYDEIFLNERGEVCEGARSNIIVKQDGVFYTPPESSGLLNGVYRQKLLNENFCREKVLYLDDLKSADRIYCVNSVRGMVEVQLDNNR